MKRLFLDDIRNPKDCLLYMNKRVDCSIYSLDWIIVRSHTDFVNYISLNGLPDLISYDHDLGESDELTGMDCAKWLVDYCLDNDKNLPNFIVHSANPSGADNISGLFESFKKFKNI